MSTDDTRSPFLPLLLLGLAVAGWSAFQTWQLVKERSALQALLGNQENMVQAALKMRSQFEAIATESQQLADAGNGNAALIVAELRKRGVNITLPKPGETPAQGDAKK